MEQKSLPMTREQVEKAKNFHVAVERRNCQGAAAPEQVEKMLEHQKECLDRLQKYISNRRKQWEEADTELHKLAKEYIESRHNEISV